MGYTYACLMGVIMKAVSLRQQFVNSIEPGGIAGDRRDVVPASGFSFSAQQIWKIIMENKDLNLPSHKVMVAIVRCEEIGDKKLAAFVADEDRCQIDKNAKFHAVSGFGKKLSSIIEAYLSEYDEETAYFDDDIRTNKRKLLEANMLQLVQPAYRSMLEHMGSQILNIFKEEFDKALTGGEVFSIVARDCTESFMTRFNKECEDAIIEQANWDSSKESIRLRRDLDAHVAAVRDIKLYELSTQYEEKLIVALSGRVEDLLYVAGDNTWPGIRNLLLHETESAVSAYSTEISCFNVDKQAKLEMLQKLKDYGIWVVQQKAREEADRVLVRMKDRFMKLFIYDIDSKPRVWSTSEDIPQIREAARSASLKLLSVMAAIRLDGEADNIQNTLFSALMTNNDCSASPELLASTTWQEIPLSKILTKPVECRSMWEQFNKDIEHVIREAQEAQQNAKDKEATQQANNKAWVTGVEIVIGVVATITGTVASIYNARRR